jgi:hypothetical protein
VSQLGAGFESGYPGTIDTRQKYRNVSSIAPDSDTRLDAEFLNDTLAAIVQMQTSLGAMVQGNFASLAARLAQFIPGGGGVPNVLAFSGQSVITLAGAVHHQQSPAILYQVYDASTPRNALEPASVTVSPTNYDLVMTFGSAQTGSVVLGAPAPQYTTRFTDALTLVIPGSVHGLLQNTLFFQVYDASDPAVAIQAGPLTIHPVTRDVTLYFAFPQSGLIILSAGGPRYQVSFTGVSTLTVPGSVHGLGSAALLYQCYDASAIPAALSPATVTVHPTTFDVVVTFGGTQSGTLALTTVASTTGQDFDIRDAGLVDQTAVRVLSSLGNLYLQAGSSDAIYFRNRLGGAVGMFQTALSRLGIGMLNPAFQLQLGSGPAAKPDGNLWTVSSDERLKTVLGPFTDGLDLILQLAPVWFQYNGLAGMPVTGQSLVGIIAQTLQPLAPYMVGSYRGKLTPEDTEETDILTYDGNAMTFVLINGMQEQTTRIVALEAALPALTTRVEALEVAIPALITRIEALEAALPAMRTSPAPPPAPEEPAL